MARTPAPDSRERILRTAARLFYYHGVQAVGTNRIIAAAGTGKQLLYQHFATKDDLVTAYLELVRERRTTATRRALAEAGPDPGEQLVAIVAEVGELLRDPDFRGCAFRNYLLERPGPAEDPAEAGAGPAEVARGYLADTRAEVEDLAARLGSPDPTAVTDQIWLLVDALYLRAGYRAHLGRNLTGAAAVDAAAVDAALRLARTVVGRRPPAGRGSVRGAGSGCAADEVAGVLP